VRDALELSDELAEHERGGAAGACQEEEVEEDGRATMGDGKTMQERRKITTGAHMRGSNILMLRFEAAVKYNKIK
jgi:hypothetical protein